MVNIEHYMEVFDIPIIIQINENLLSMNREVLRNI
jgi:hypothetical protein